MLGKAATTTAALIVICGAIWVAGYEQGKSVAREAHLEAIIEVTRKAEEAAAHRTKLLADIRETILLADEEIETIRKGLFDEDAAPGNCDIRTDWMRRLDKIR